MRQSPSSQRPAGKDSVELIQTIWIARPAGAEPAVAFARSSAKQIPKKGSSGEDAVAARFGGIPLRSVTRLRAPAAAGIAASDSQAKALGYNAKEGSIVLGRVDVTAVQVVP